MFGHKQGSKLNETSEIVQEKLFLGLCFAQYLNLKIFIFKFTPQPTKKVSKKRIKNSQQKIQKKM